jgi:signal transduction histidine kinase
VDTDQPRDTDFPARRAVPDSDPGLHTADMVRFLLRSAHQCRSPLNTALTSLTTLLEGYAGELSGKQRRMVQGAGRKVRLALELVNDMLAMNILTLENVLEFFEAVDLGPLTESVVETLESAARQKGVEFVAQVEELPTVWAHRAGKVDAGL